MPRFPWASKLVKRSIPRRIQTFQQMLLQTWLLYLPHSVTSLRIYNISVFITTDASCKANVTVTWIAGPSTEMSPRMKKKISVTKLTVMVRVKRTASEWHHRCHDCRQNIKTLGCKQALGVKRPYFATITYNKYRKKGGTAESLLICFARSKMNNTLPIVGLLVRRWRVSFCSCASYSHYHCGN